MFALKNHLCSFAHAISSLCENRPAFIRKKKHCMFDRKQYRFNLSLPFPVEMYKGYSSLQIYTFTCIRCLSTRLLLIPLPLKFYLGYGAEAYHDLLAEEHHDDQVFGMLPMLLEKHNPSFCLYDIFQQILVDHLNRSLAAQF